MDYLQKLFSNAKEIIRNFSLTQILLMITLAVVCTIGLLLVVGVFKTASYGVLYSDLPIEEAGEISTKLDEMGIDFRLTNGGRTIKIPTDKVYQTRISLASLGMPAGGSVGYSIFDKTNLGMTDFVQKVNFRRALEGELSRTITDIEEIKAARVHIVIPEKRLFEDDQKLTTASVVLKLAGVGSLNKRQLFGITHLVASSVEGLRAENITVIDNWGNLLTSPHGGDPIAALSATQLEMKKSVESYLENKAQTLLSGALGNSRAIVRIDADLDFDQVSKSMETFDPDNIAVRSEERLESSMADSSSSIGMDTAKAGGNELSERVITNYEVSKTVETVVSSIGNIKKLSIAVMIDGTYTEVENENGDLEKQYVPRVEAEMEKLSAIVKRAVGFTSTRSDEFEIVNIAFESGNFDSEQKEMDKLGQRNFFIDIGKKVLLGIGLLFAFLYLKKKIKNAFKAIAQYNPPLSANRPHRQQQSYDTQQNNIPDEPIIIKPPKPKLVDKMKAVAEEQPDELTKVIKTMMTE
jgi:flagellar M-ring protein FliF